MTKLIEIDTNIPDKVNIETLTSELQAAGVNVYKLLFIDTRTETKPDNSVIVLNPKIECIVDDTASSSAVAAVVIAHKPAQSTEELRKAEALGQATADLLPILTEALKNTDYVNALKGALAK